MKMAVAELQLRCDEAFNSSSCNPISSHLCRIVVNIVHLRLYPHSHPPLPVCECEEMLQVFARELVLKAAFCRCLSERRQRPQLNREQWMLTISTWLLEPYFQEQKFRYLLKLFDRSLPPLKP